MGAALLLDADMMVGLRWLLVNELIDIQCILGFEPDARCVGEK